MAVLSAGTGAGYRGVSRLLPAPVITRAGRARWYLGVCLFLLAGPLSAQPAEVAITGISGELLENARALVSLRRYEATELSPGRARRLHARAPAEIARALQPFGYYQPQIDSSLRLEDGVWRARYHVEPGEPVRVARVSLELAGDGEDDPELRALVRDFPLSEGDRADQRLYERGRDSLRRRAVDRGYLDARYRHQRIIVEPGTLEAAIELQLETGPRYRFGEVRMDQDILRPEFLQRFVPFERGDPYSSRGLLDLQYALDDSGYFSRVEIEPRRDQAEDLAVPVDVQLEPRARNRYMIGPGFGTDTGPRLRAGWENRRLNRRGHRAGVDIMVSPVINSLSARYVVPIANPATDNVTYRARVQREKIEDRDSRIQNVGVTQNRLFGRWQRALRLDFERERFEVGGDPERESDLLIPGAGLVYIRATDPVYPDRGLRWEAHLKGAHRDVVSDLSFAQLRTELRLIYRLHPRGRLLLRGEAGGSSVEEFAELPLSQRFFAGGDHSVRGFRYESLGPEDGDGDVVGGRHLVTASMEYEYRFARNWAAAVFHDQGNAFDKWDDFVLRETAGAGIRWLTPVGPLRLDVARPIDVGGGNYRLHLTLGGDL